MTSTSNGPKKPRKTPLGRRLKYLAQDAGYATKKAARKVTDPIRDSKPSRPRARPKPTAAAKKAEAPVRRPKAPARKPRRPAASRKASTSGARELGERPAPRRRPAAAKRPRAARKRRGLPKPTAAGTSAAITGFGERSSKAIRGAVAPLGPPLAGLAAIGRRGVTWLAKVVTPLRAALLVAAAAAILLGISQFVDYRGVAVGVADYAAYEDVGIVAPAPQVDRDPAGSAHAYLLVPVAAIALVLLVLCARGRWQLGWIVSLLGLFGIAVSLLVDVSAGLDESVQAIAYEGVEAQLIEGFYAQLFAAVVLVFGGLLVSRYARRTERRVPRARRRAAGVEPARAGAT